MERTTAPAAAGEEGGRRRAETGIGKGGRGGGVKHRHPLLGENEDEGKRRDGESVLLMMVVVSQVLARKRRQGVSARGTEGTVDMGNDQKGQQEWEKEVEEVGSEKKGGASGQCRLGRSRRSRRHASEYKGTKGMCRMRGWHISFVIAIDLPLKCPLSS